MITTIYTCDNCGNEHDKPEGMRAIKVSVSNAMSHFSSQNEIKKLWCLNCLKKYGIPEYKPEETTEIIKPKTFGEKLEAIIRTEIEEAIEDSIQ